MKRISLITALIWLSFAAMAKDNRTVKAHFNETTELVSTVMYLAEAEEYTWTEFPELKKAVDEYFAPYRDMEVINTVKTNHRRGFSFSTPMDLALNIEVKGGHIVKNRMIAPDTTDYYQHITPEMEQTIIRQMDEFYRNTQFHRFYKQQRPLYARAEEAFNAMMAMVDFKWFDSFFYPDADTRFNVVVSLLNGPSNYSSTIYWKDGSKSIVSTMGCAAPDDNGNPEYDSVSMIPILIHECSHGFCNPLNEAFWDDMKEVAQEYFDRDSTFFMKTPYPAPTFMMNETFVESSVVRYLMSHDLHSDRMSQQELVDIYINYVGVENSHWVLEPIIVEALDEREKHPDLYPTMRDFMPRLCEILNGGFYKLAF